MSEQHHIERWDERIAARKELDPWIDGGFHLQKAGGSVIHRLWAAEEAGLALWLLAVPGTDPTLKIPPDAQSLVVQHNWAAAFEGATDFDAGDFRLPYDICCFEFKISDKRVCAFVMEREDAKAIMVFVETARCWVMPITMYHLREGLWQPVVSDADDRCRALPPFIAAQVRAICISLEAEVAAHETISRPEKLNAARLRRGKPPLPPYRVLYLNNRPRSLMADGASEGLKKRLHFRRGHWRNLTEDRRAWVRWCLVGDPNLGFIDKEYRL
jgi:hypothetical protein